MPPSIYDYVVSEEKSFESEEIKIGDNWNWNLRNHVQLIFHLKHGVFFKGANDWKRAFKNVMESILELAYWTEDIEVKDIVFFIENRLDRGVSFLVKKYHEEVYLKENDLDTFLDEITESDLDYGGVLVQRTDSPRPEVLPLMTIAFCDQTDIENGPIAFKHDFSPDGLRKMAKAGWGKESNGANVSLEDLIYEAQTEKSSNTDSGTKNQTPGKIVEVYIVRGNLPEHYLKDNDNMDDWYNQVQIISCYYGKDNRRNYGILYRKKEAEGNMKFFTSKKVEGRALGRGIGERLIHPQIWTNFLTIHKMKMLEAAAKVPLVTDDQNFADKNKVINMEMLEITTVDEGRTIRQIPTAATANIQLYEASINEWYQQAQQDGAAYDPLMGKEQPSGTTFRGQERSVAQGKGPHDRRRGQRAKFIEEIYRDWIIPDMKRDMMKGKKFISTLTADEFRWVAEQLASNYAAKTRTENVLNGQPPGDEEELKQEFLTNFQKKGNQHLLELMKEDLEDAELRMGINIASKQKDLVGLTDKLLSIFQFASANPIGFQQTLKIPAMAHALEDILEFSGLSQADFSSVTMPPDQMQQMMQQMQPQQAPQQLLPQAVA